MRLAFLSLFACGFVAVAGLRAEDRHDSVRVLAPVVSVEHPAAVVSVGFSSDGGRILTGCLDGNLRLFDLTTTDPVGVEAPIVVPCDSIVNSLAARPTGDWLLVGLDEEGLLVVPAGVRDVEAAGSGVLRVRHSGLDYDRGVSRILVSRDGTRALTKGLGNLIVYWSLESTNSSAPMTETAKFKPDLTDTIFDVALVGNGPFVLFARQKVVELRSIPANGEGGNWAVLATSETHNGYVVGISATPDGALAASCGHDNQIVLWSVGTGQAPALTRLGAVAASEGRIDQLTYAGQVNRLTLSADGLWLVTSYYQASMPMMLWRVSPQASPPLTPVASLGDLGEEPTARAANHQHMAFSPDSRYLLAVAEGHRAKLWRVPIE